MDRSITRHLSTDDLRNTRAHVSRVSELDYFLEICRNALKLKQLTKKELSEAVIKKRLEIERKRPIDSSTRISLPTLEGKIRRGHLSEGAIKDTIKLCLKWNLLTPTNRDVYTATNECVRIGECVERNDLNTAKIELLNAIIKSGSERLFDPQNFLLKIRNSVTTSVTPFITLSRKGDKREKKVIHLSQIAVPQDEGIVYNDYSFTYGVLNTNPVSLSVIFDWADYFRLVNFAYPEFDLKDMVKKVKDEIQKEGSDWRVTGVYPTKAAYLCKIIVTFDELINLMVYLDAHGRSCDVNMLKDHFKVTDYVKTCLLYTAQKLDLIRIKDNRVEANKSVPNFGQLVDLALKAQCLVLSDGESIRGVVQSYTKDLDPRTTYVISEPEWDLKTFLKALWIRYYELIEGKTFLYASISRLREKVCKDLRIHNDVFDDYLNKCRLEYPNHISLSLGSAEIKSRLKFKRFEKAFMLYGRSYYLIKVRGYPD